MTKSAYKAAQEAAGAALRAYRKAERAAERAEATMYMANDLADQLWEAYKAAADKESWAAYKDSEGRQHAQS